MKHKVKTNFKAGKKLILLLTLLIVQLVPTPRDCTLNIENCMCQWGNEVRLTNAPGPSYTSENNQRCIVSANNNIHIVWTDKRSSDNRIYYKRSIDGGTNWGNDICLTSTSSSNPSISVYNNNVYVVWNDDRFNTTEIFYKKSTDGGTSWGNDFRLTNDTGHPSLFPVIEVSGSYVFIVYHKFITEISTRAIYKRSTDGGTNWGSEIQICALESAFPSISVAGQSVHIVWQDQRLGGSSDRIYYKRSSNYGENWSIEFRLSNSTSFYPSISSTGSDVHVVMSKLLANNTYDVIYEHSLDGGINWEQEKSFNLYDHLDKATISASGSKVHIVIYKWVYSSSYHYLKYSRSVDRGNNWSNPYVLTDEYFTERDPFISASGNGVHVIWTDFRHGIFETEIYYKRNPTGNVFETPVLLSPANNSLNVTLTPLLDWSDAVGAAKYRLQVSINSGFTSFIEDWAGNYSSQYQFAPNVLQGATKYYWRVNSINGNDTSAWSTVWNFTTGLAGPVLHNPSNNQTGIWVDYIFFNWDTATYATSYRIRVSANSSFNTTVFDDTINHPSHSCTSVFNPPLSFNTIYYWKVYSINASGATSSQTWSFTTESAPPAPPAVRLIYPPNNSNNIPVRPQFDWADTTYATKYQLQIATNSGFTAIIWDTTVLLSNAIPPVGKLNSLTTYYWRVRGIDYIVNGIWSAVWHFQTSNASPPAYAPTLLTPANNSIDLYLNPVLSWTPVNYATGYQLRLWEYSETWYRIDTIISGTSLMISMGKLKSLTKYRWLVYPLNSGGYGPPSATWDFTTIRPNVPVLLLPPNNSVTTNTDITFRWQNMQYTYGFKVQVATDANFQSIVYNSNNIQTDSFRLTGLSPSQYYWRACAKGKLGDGYWTPPWKFTITSTGMNQFSSEIPTEFKLHYNYPNPFNPTTKIKFDLPKNTFARLAVYDITGREIEVLLNRNLNAGVYIADFNASKLPSGVYFYRLTAGDFAETKRMVLIK